MPADIPLPVCVGLMQAYTVCQKDTMSCLNFAVGHHAMLALVPLQALANLAWSMAHLGYKQEAVLDAIVNRLLSDVDSMNQRDVADLLSALAILKHQPVGEAMAAVMHHTIELLQDSGGISITVKCVNNICGCFLSSFV